MIFMILTSINILNITKITEIKIKLHISYN